MSGYQKKYITIKDASIISGYTAAELRNFVKIGLVPFRKVKNRVYIRFDAFEKINAHTSNKGSTVAEKTGGAKLLSNTKTKKGVPMTSLIPFVKPSRTLVKFLEPVAFAAALMMAVYITALPGVSENVVFGIGVTEATVDYMADAATDLIATAVDIPMAAAEVLATSVFPAPAVPRLADTSVVGQVAGVATASGVEQANSGSADKLSEGVTNILIAIADASDSFQSIVEQVSYNGFNFIISNLRFEKLDPVIQKTFQW